MTDWSQPQPVGSPVALEGHVPFTYVLTHEEREYLYDHGFQQSVVTPDTRWVKTFRTAPLDPPTTAVVEMTPRGIVLKITRGRGPDAASQNRFTSVLGLQVIPLLIRAQLAGDL
jgi:hypothetical protein